MASPVLSEDVSIAAQSQLQIDEGKGPEGLGHVYLDTKDIPTIGYGYNIAEASHQGRLAELGYNVNEVLAGRQEISEQHANLLFQESFSQAVNDAGKYLPNLETYPPEVQQVVVNMAFNLGDAKLSEFVHLQEALVNRDFETAAKEMVDSKWHDQVGDRGERLVNMMESAVGKEPTDTSLSPTSFSTPLAPSLSEPQFNSGWSSDLPESSTTHPEFNFGLGLNLGLLSGLALSTESQHSAVQTEAIDESTGPIGNGWLSGISESLGLGVQSNPTENAVPVGPSMIEQMGSFFGIGGSSQNTVDPYSSQGFNNSWHAEQEGGSGLSSLFSHPFESSQPTFDAGPSPSSHNDSILSHSSSDYSSSHFDNGTSSHSDSGGSHSDSGGGDSGGGSSGGGD